MRVMVFVKATTNSEAGIMPSEDLFVAMGKFNEELVAAGVMVDGDGLKPTKHAKRVRMAGEARDVTDGPFDATTELVAGYWIWNVASMDEAVAWAKKCPDPMPGEEGTLEIRPYYELEDFGEALPAEQRAAEEAMREVLAAGNGAPPAAATPKTRTCLWFEKGGEEAAAFYVSLVPGSAIEGGHGPEGGPPLVLEFTLAGAPMMILNAPGAPKPTHAASISVLTDSQAETDRLWAALTADGGAEVACGWLTDRWGVSWQIVPRRMPALLGSPDRAAAGRAMAAMQSMVKLDIDAIEAAFRGE